MNTPSFKIVRSDTGAQRNLSEWNGINIYFLLLLVIGFIRSQSIYKDNQ